MKYYEVNAKCGHAGRNHYLLKKFYIKAEDGRQAALITRYRGRVKHNQKDAIRSVKQITLLDYMCGLINNALDPYFNVNCIQESRRNKAISEDEIYDEIPPIKYKRDYHYRYLKQKSYIKSYQRIDEGGIC